MEIHEATDVYAHSVFGYTSQQGWTRFYHETSNGNDYADKTGFANQRFIVAQEVAENIVKRYYANQTGDYNQFIFECSYNSNVFKLFQLREYLEVASGNYIVGILYANYSRDSFGVK